MEISYELTSDDLDARDAYFRDSVKHMLRPHLWTKRAIAEGVLGGFLFFVPAMFFVIHHSWNSILFVVYLASVAIGLTKLSAYMDRKKCRGLLYEKLASDGIITVRTTNDVIEVKSSKSSTLLKRGAVEKIVNLQNHLILQLGPFHGFVIPHRAFQDDAELKNFIQEAARL